HLERGRRGAADEVNSLGRSTFHVDAGIALAALERDPVRADHGGAARPREALEHRVEELIHAAAPSSRSFCPRFTPSSQRSSRSMAARSGCAAFPVGAAKDADA